MESRWHLNLLKIDQKTIRIKNNDQTVKEVPRINVWRPAMPLPLLLAEREVDGDATLYGRTIVHSRCTGLKPLLSSALSMICTVRCRNESRGVVPQFTFWRARIGVTRMVYLDCRTLLFFDASLIRHMYISPKKVLARREGFGSRLCGQLYKHSSIHTHTSERPAKGWTCGWRSSIDTCKV